MKIYNKDQKGFFYKEPTVFSMKITNDFITIEEEDIANEIPLRKILSDKRKILITLHSSFFHSVLDQIGLILNTINSNDFDVVILDIGSINKRKYLSGVMLTAMDILFKSPLEIIVVSLVDQGPILIDNVCYSNNSTVYYDRVKAISYFAEQIDTDKAHAPTKKVYLSRKLTHDKGFHGIFNNEDPENFIFKDDIRIKDEAVLEAYFKSLGFEIIYPENFLNFEEQIIFFRDVKILAAPTTAALANMCFMKDNGIVLELCTPLVVGGREEMHSHYSGLSWAKKHLYISIPHSRESTEIIKSIEDNHNLRGMLSE